MALPLSLYGLSPEDLVKVLELPRPFEGKQIYRWLAKGVTDFQEMSDLSKAERERLSGLMPKATSSEVADQHADSDGSTKLALKLYDGSLVECVMLENGKGEHTACLSSQVGCAQHCAFCRTGTMGLERNLAAEEIIEQFIHLNKIEPASHIVFMGMGEPLANLDNVLRAIAYFHDKDTFNLSLRRITISTSGVVPGIRRLAATNLPLRLAVSLVSADDRLRNELMPVNRTFPLADLKRALQEYQEGGGKRFTFEYCMLGGTNTSESSAKKLAAYIRGLDVIVNLIPYNEAAELPWSRPDEKEIGKFCRYLDMFGVKYTIRYSKGRGVNGACGQLATKTKEKAGSNQ